MPQALPFGTDRVSDSITEFRGLKRSFDWEIWIVLRMCEWTWEPRLPLIHTRNTQVHVVDKKENRAATIERH